MNNKTPNRQLTRPDKKFTLTVVTLFLSIFFLSSVFASGNRTRSCSYDIYVKDKDLGSIPLRFNPVVSVGRAFTTGEARWLAAVAAENCLNRAARGAESGACREQFHGAENSDQAISRTANRWISSFKYDNLRSHARTVLCESLLAKGRNIARGVKIFSRVRAGATNDIARECSIPAAYKNIGNPFWAGKARNAPKYKTLTTINKVSCKTVRNPKKNKS